MFKNKLFTLMSAVLLVGATSGGCQAQAYDPQTKPADNSGRRLALVVPLMPEPAAHSAKPSSTVGGAKPRAASSAPQPDEEGDNAAGLPISTSVRVRLTPKAQQALDMGVDTAKNIAAIASKRVSDLCAWLWILLKQNQQPPLATPANGMATMPTVSQADMRPIAEPSKGTVKQLILTSERRLRTVVNR